MSDEHQIDREDCYICGRGNPDVLERHHIVPRRHGGSDESVNLVDLCPTCHSALETLYDERFYRVLGIGEQGEIVRYAAGDIAERLEQLELHVSMEVHECRKQIANEFVTGLDEDELVERYHTIRTAAEKYIEENNESDEASEGRTKVVEKVYDIIEDYEYTTSEVGTPIDHIIERASELGVNQGKTKAVVEELCHQGRVYEPQPDKFRAVV